MSWFERVLQDRHVKDCLFVLNDLGSEFRDQLAWSIVAAKAKAALGNNSKTLRTKILSDGDTPKNVVLTLIANICLNEASSGQNHVYRGRLSMTGKSYRTIFHAAVKAQSALGAITEEEREQAILNLAEAIEDAG